MLSVLVDAPDLFLGLYITVINSIIFKGRDIMALMPRLPLKPDICKETAISTLKDIRQDNASVNLKISANRSNSRGIYRYSDNTITIYCSRLYDITDVVSVTKHEYFHRLQWFHDAKLMSRYSAFMKQNNPLTLLGYLLYFMSPVETAARSFAQNPDLVDIHDNLLEVQQYLSDLSTWGLIYTLRNCTISDEDFRKVTQRRYHNLEEGIRAAKDLQETLDLVTDLGITL